jgi:hypothetical protein
MDLLALVKLLMPRCSSTVCVAMRPGSFRFIQMTFRSLSRAPERADHIAAGATSGEVATTSGTTHERGTTIVSDFIRCNQLFALRRARQPGYSCAGLRFLPPVYMYARELCRQTLSFSSVRATQRRNQMGTIANISSEYRQRCELPVRLSPGPLS